MRGRLFVLTAIDAFVVNVSFFLCLMVRYGGQIPAEVINTYYLLVGPFTLVWLASFYFFKLYHKMWEYASIGELFNVIRAVSVATLINGAVALLACYFTSCVLPFSIIPLLWALNILFIGGSRLAWRIYRDRWMKPVSSDPRTPVLIVGAGDAGAVVARELNNHQYKGGLYPIGFVDKDPNKHGLQLMGIPVLGDRKDIPRIVHQYGVQQVILAIPSASKRDKKEIVEICQELKVKIRTLPSVYDLLDGRVSIKDLRDIEVGDLLGREPVSVDLESMSRYIKDHVVLVTGAAGSIGSVLCNQIALLKPKLLILLDNYENYINEVHLDLARRYPDLNLEVQVIDVKDKYLVNRCFKDFKPDVVFHAAAHKHVPLMENNPLSAVKNNVLGTKNVVEAAGKNGAGVFIFISTDKAVNPTSVMGATKRLAEIIVQHYNLLYDTRYAAVRFGNVLASYGSVIPLFRKQIARGGPVTVTHPEMTRFFMTIPEAAQLVIQAGAMAEGGEIFILDMGEPVKILDLAETVIRLSGFEPYKDIDIEFIGMRPGEKLYEELMTEKEGVKVTRHQRIFVSSFEDYSIKKLEPFLANLSTPQYPRDNAEAIQVLEQLVPGYKKDWMHGGSARGRALAPGGVGAGSVGPGMAGGSARHSGGLGAGGVAVGAVAAGMTPGSAVAGGSVGHSGGLGAAGGAAGSAVAGGMTPGGEKSEFEAYAEKKGQACVGKAREARRGQSEDPACGAHASESAKEHTRPSQDREQVKEAKLRAVASGKVHSLTDSSEGNGACNSGGESAGNLSSSPAVSSLDGPAVESCPSVCSTGSSAAGLTGGSEGSTAIGAAVSLVGSASSLADRPAVISAGGSAGSLADDRTFGSRPAGSLADDLTVENSPAGSLADSMEGSMEVGAVSSLGDSASIGSTQPVDQKPRPASSFTDGSACSFADCPACNVTDEPASSHTDDPGGSLTDTLKAESPGTPMRNL